MTEYKFALRPLTQSEIDTYRKQYIDDGYLLVHKLFDDKTASVIYDFYSRDMASDWWFLATAPTKQNVIQCRHENKQQLIDLWDEAGSKLDRGGMVYRFYRTTAHVKECPCLDCKIKEFINSKDMLDLINSITKQETKTVSVGETSYTPESDEVSTTHSIFASKYTAGCYLTYHTDLGNGKIAFVMNFSKDWQPSHGGMLHMLEDDLKNTKKVFYPEFNSLVLFRVKSTGTPHFVSPVIDDTTNVRYAVSGWFK